MSAMNPSALSATIDARQSSLIVKWDDGTSAEYAAIWLRDNLPQDRDPHSGQRLIDVTDIPCEPRMRAATLCGPHLQIEWQQEPLAASFPLSWLYEQSAAAQRRSEGEPRLWLQGSGLTRARDFAQRTVAEIRNDSAARLDWLARLLGDGIAFLREVPCDDAGILDAVKLVGRVVETNYGLVFDVRAVPQPENLAYSDRGLGLHTDNPYREPVPGFQALHTLMAAPDGGDSLFADGFALAEHLRACHPQEFALLTRTAVPFSYRSQQADLQARRPLIALDCLGAVTAVHYNSRSIAPLPLAVRECRSFYHAYRCFAQLLRERRFQLCTRLEAGDLVVFDNQRILHGRTGFASAKHARHLRGCYLSRDSVCSETALLRRRLRPEAQQ